MREYNQLSVRITSQSQHSACDRPPVGFPSPRRCCCRRRCVLLFFNDDVHPPDTEKVSGSPDPPHMYPAARAGNSPYYDILRPPPNPAINMHPGCAVFTCRLSHVILQERTLILLHCPSTVNSCTKSTSFHSILPVSAQTATVPPSEEWVGCLFFF